MIIGGSAPKTMSSYYVANPQMIDKLKKRLKANGFEILSTDNILKHKIVLTVTNDELKKTNTFLATLHILINGIDEIRVQNPSYFAAAYLKDKYKYGQFKSTLISLQKTLGQMYIGVDKYEFLGLDDYNLLFGMSKFEDTIELAEGTKLTDKLKEKDASKYFAYSLQLPNGSTLVGHKFTLNDNKFLNNVNAQNSAQLLPYQSIIKDSKAYMLDPKYFLSLSLPHLTITDFMKISTTPDMIEDNLIKAYR